jgi:hypothetical protein
MSYQRTMWRRLFCCLLAISLTGLLFADERAMPWRAVRVIPAPEAHQAAAADEHFLFAITNDRIAKYDRATRKRLSVSTGAAQHLNSGYFWNGKLYCAHSNYPRVPEKSEIMVLDPESMRLTPFKEFGNYGGSLTWAVRHEGFWWCNFARYGARNSETFLVKFDSEWKELARWTYPPEVIEKLGRNSLSGGVWLDGFLLATGHDDPVLFRLKLPESGSVLQLVDQQTIPFSGQGIASDPKTGGLVGIHRGKRKLILAVPAN